MNELQDLSKHRQTLPGCGHSATVAGQCVVSRMMSPAVLLVDVSAGTGDRGQGLPKPGCTPAAGPLAGSVWGTLHQGGG